MFTPAANPRLAALMITFTQGCFRTIATVSSTDALSTTRTSNPSSVFRHESIAPAELYVTMTIGGSLRTVGGSVARQSTRRADLSRESGRAALRYLGLDAASRGANRRRQRASRLARTGRGVGPSGRGGAPASTVSQ